jgi:hypothetical protein
VKIFEKKLKKTKKKSRPEISGRDFFKQAIVNQP